jgi:hypothetical protein
MSRKMLRIFRLAGLTHRFARVNEGVAQRGDS